MMISTIMRKCDRMKRGCHEKWNSPRHNMSVNAFPQSVMIYSIFMSSSSVQNSTIGTVLYLSIQDYYHPQRKLITTGSMYKNFNKFKF